jgi:murein DD-endopeptidase MepM/ murein hydrolase activator NlpD
MYRHILAIFLGLLVIWISCLPLSVFANNYTIDPNTRIPSIISDDGTQMPDWSQITLDDIPPIAKGGSFDISNIATDYSKNELISILGYDPSRSWQVGDRLSDLLKLGDLKGVSNLSQWSLSDVAAAVGIDVSELKNLRLSDYGLIKNQTVEDLVFAIPTLAGIPVKDVKPLYDMASLAFGAGEVFEGHETIGDLAASNFEFANLKMDSIDLSQYDLSEIEGIEDANFGDFAGSEGAATSEIPYMEYVQMASYIFELANFNFLGKIDVVYGEKEARRINTVSGSYQEGFNVPCDQDSCAYIELTDAMDVGLDLASLHGKQWISGKSQIVEGGFGPLKYANVIPSPGKEPTGRNVFGEFFKVVLTDTDESAGRADFGLYFRFCMYIFGYRTCTPYFIGPFPWFSHHEKDTIILGLGGTASGHVPSPPPGFSGNPDGSYVRDDVGEEVSTTGAEDCTSYKGVNMGALSRAIANIESRGSGDYLAVGDWVIADRGTNQGRALGKYQYMSYREEVVAIFSQKEGGLDLLKRIEQDRISEAEIKRQLPIYFPPSVQEKVRQQDWRNLINSAYNLGKRDSQIAYQLGGWHYAGVRGFDTGYAKRAEAEYKKELGKSQQKCQQYKQQQKAGQKCQGKLIKPASSGVRTSGFGSRLHPITKRYTNHNGVDLGAPTRTPILAADGGEVIFVQSGCQVGNQSCGGGFGNYIKIRHCNGWITYYAHLSSVSVKFNQKVSQGQKIGGMGTTGRSTGSHLHFELHIGGDGNPVDPEKYLPKL